MSTSVDVLVIEDSPELRTVLVAVLEEQGCSVAAAEKGTDGLQLIRALAPRLVLCDLVLPDLDGLAIWCSCHEFCQQTGATFVLMSASRQVTEIPEGVLYLPKPFDLGELLKLVERTARQAPSLAEQRAPAANGKTPSRSVARQSSARPTTTRPR